MHSCTKYPPKLLGKTHPGIAYLGSLPITSAYDSGYCLDSNHSYGENNSNKFILLNF